jgi:signal transduction histidine kinase
MRVETVVSGFLAAVASTIAFLQWRGRVVADSENERLRDALAAREDQERARISRLEHDLKSPLGVILGYSTLLREYLEEHAAALPPLAGRSINGIDQAAQKIVRILESAADGEEALVEEKTRP